MLKTVLHQKYTGNIAVDSSGFFNHGQPIMTTASFPGFSFNQAGSRINVRPAASLNDLECIRAGVVFTLQPRGTTHRFNLMEGYLSFSLFVTPDHALSGTINDQSGNWTGATSAPKIVTSNVQHTALLESDGVSMVRISLDGKIVGENYAVPGEVRSVGNLGLAIGHWPDPPDVYTFEGVIYEVLLQKYDPQKDLTSALDPCCFDQKAILCWWKGLAKRGITPAMLAKASLTLKDALRQVVIAERGGTKTGTTAQQNMALAFSAALKKGDYAELEFILEQAQSSIGSQIGATQVAQLKAAVDKAYASFGLEWADWSKLMQLLCLDIYNTKSREGNCNGC
jgi:hypothetical protein